MATKLGATTILGRAVSRNARGLDDLCLELMAIYPKLLQGKSHYILPCSKNAKLDYYILASSTAAASCAAASCAEVSEL